MIYYNTNDILYYIKIGLLYKIGITTKTVHERYYRNRFDFEVISITRFNTGQEALNFETKLLRKFKHLKYTGPKLFCGNNEIFIKDIRGLSDLF